MTWREETKLIGLVVFLAVVLLGGWVSAGEPQTIVFLTWKPNQPEVWQRLIASFQEEHPEIRIQIQMGPHSSTEYHAIVTQRLKNRDSSVDVFFMDVVWPPEFASAGWALDLASRFPEEARRRFLSPPIDANSYGDGIYGVPCYLGAGLFYYRKDLLEKYRFAPPKTWDEMLTQGSAIVRGEGDPTLHIYSAQFKQYEGLVCNMLEFMWSHGGGVLDGQTRRVLLADRPAVDAVTFVRDKIIGGAAPQGVVNYEEPESLEVFIQGRSVFHRNWPYAWAVASDPDKSKVAGKIGVGALPAFPGHAPASALGGWQFGISRWSKHPDEAWAFVEFMTSPSSQKRLAMEAGLAPTRLEVYEDPEVQAKMPHLQCFLPAFQSARSRPATPLYPMISQELQRFFSRAGTDRKTDVATLARKTAATIERIVAMEGSVQR
jgi:multiple sugar transport system substrate-binding protein